MLSDHALSALVDPSNDLFYSLVTVWEGEMKRVRGKLDIPPDTWDVLSAHSLDELPITRAHALTASSLPSLHKDPFDRMLVAQAQVEGMTLVTADRHLSAYGIPVLW